MNANFPAKMKRSLMLCSDFLVFSVCSTSRSRECHAKLGRGKAQEKLELLVLGRALLGSALKSVNSALLRNCSVSRAGFSTFSASSDDSNNNNNNSRPAYLDYQSTTPVDPRVMDSMIPFLGDMFGNPHSRTHTYGWEAEDHVEKARDHIAKLINSNRKNIIFTSGATESNNLAIKGVCKFYGKLANEKEATQNADRGKTFGSEGFATKPNLKNHIITTQIEHKCVLASCRALQEEGYDVTYLNVNSEGLIDLDELEKSIRPSTIMCSIMHVNNEIGVIQDLEEIGKICRKRGIFFHTDAAQSVGKVPVDVEKMNIDLMSVSAHKIYAPKGIGALYVRSKPRVRLYPLIHGGAQERGLRSGTLPVALIVGFGEACRIAQHEMESDRRHIEKLAKKFYREVTNKIPHVKLNGCKAQRYYGNMNFSFSCVEGESLLMSLKEIAVSSGSACTSASLEPSYVLRAIGVSEDLAHTSLRFGIGRFTTEQEIDKCVESLVKQVSRLRNMSPLFELMMDDMKKKQEGKPQENTTKFVWT